jgi:D-alanyl-D-alanine dipeptidase
MKELINLKEQNIDIIFDIRYATKNNICNVQLYNQPFCYLNKDCFEKLKKAVEISKNLNLKIKIFDSYRPFEVQQFMYNQFIDKEGFVSNPQGGAVPHCRGVAIDLTLVDKNNTELDMGSDFDEFSIISNHNCTQISSEAYKNRLILLGIMTNAGFDFYQQEWWHYQLFNCRQYPIIEADSKMSLV